MERVAVSEPTFVVETWMVVLGLAAAGAIVKVSMWVGSVNSDRASFKEFIDKIEKKLDDLVRRVDEIGNDVAGIKGQIKPAATSGQSPVQLTDYGQEVSNKLKIRQWAEHEADRLTGTVKGKQEFEIFDACKEYVGNHFERDSDFNAFVRAGAYDIGREKEVVFEVCAVELRDAVLARLQN